MAAGIGFGIADQIRLATAVSELTRNVLQYAGIGVCSFEDASDGTQIRLRATVEDNGPGILDIGMAMKDGFSTSHGLGAGLPGTRRLMDVFYIESVPGLTRIIITLERERLLESSK
ncbi:anti-sigma regulatory factor [Candidatus Symbiobacter mobilis]|nr:anti-sigma regulatory factor [Candidatus Symbiobacter mobilis]